MGLVHSLMRFVSRALSIRAGCCHSSLKSSVSDCLAALKRLGSCSSCPCCPCKLALRLKPCRKRRRRCCCSCCCRCRLPGPGPAASSPIRWLAACSVSAAWVSACMGTSACAHDLSASVAWQSRHHRGGPTNSRLPTGAEARSTVRLRLASSTHLQSVGTRHQLPALFTVRISRPRFLATTYRHDDESTGRWWSTRRACSILAPVD